MLNNDVRAKTLKEKAQNGLQMIRLPRCATTATRTVLSQLLPEGKFQCLGEGCFSDMPFSWGPYHNQVLNWPKDIDPLHPDFSNTMELMRQNLGFGSEIECVDIIESKPKSPEDLCLNPQMRPDLKTIKVTKKSWVRDFNVRLDQKSNYDPNKLTFQIVRNPFDWLISIYSWNFMGINGVPPDIEYALDLIKYDTSDSVPVYSDGITPGIKELFYNLLHSHNPPFKKAYHSFEEFINYIFQVPKNAPWSDKVRFPFPYPMMNRCFFQAFDNDRNCKADVFIRFEYLVEGLQTLIDLGDYQGSVRDIILDPSIRKKQTNYGPNSTFDDYKYKFYKDIQTIEKVQSAYNWDLQAFNYDFSGPRDNIVSFLGGTV
jgi:hypothetical protein